MRILLEKGKQKELIKKYKIAESLTSKDLADFLKIPLGRLKAYFDETSLITEEIFNKLNNDKTFSKFIIEIKKDNWGKIKGGKNSLGSTKKINFPEDSNNLAEFYGIMLGDGNSHRTKAYKKGTYMIRIVGDTVKDREYLTNYVKPMIEKLFKINVRVGKFKSNAMFIEAHSKNLIDFLEIKGFKPGDKIRNQLGIPEWIKNNKKFLKVCLRGLYDTDGSVYRLTNQNSHQIDFCNYNPVLLEDVRASLISLGINPSKISKQKDVYITKKEEIAKFLKVVGFHNPKHLCRLEMFGLRN